MKSTIVRGSEWRRWELHLHTPETQKNDQFEGSTPEEKWDNFYKAIAEYVGDGSDPLKAVSVIAITDYLSADNYFKVLRDKRLPDCVKLVLPNVEMRALPIAKEAPLNIHCIFSPEVADSLESRFFSRLEFVNGKGGRYSAVRAELIRLGRDHSGDHDLDPEAAYRIGLEQFVVSVDSLIDLFESDKDLRNKTIIVVSNKSNDGASGVVAHSAYFEGDKKSQLDEVRRKVYCLADMIYSASQSDINYFLGKSCDDEANVKRKCGSLKPCIHGCDAHSNAEIFEPACGRYCWIKADPTFEGLKQVMYEPGERVYIGSKLPDQKQDYYVIDRVEITNTCFDDENPIYFNDKLTCIIGGKSTGKSLLLHNMAIAIDPEQVTEKLKIASTNVSRIPGLKVYWRDNVCSDDKSHSRKIVYIPQSYLNRLSDAKEERTEIDSIVEDIIMQNDDARVFYQQLNDNIATYKQEVAKTVVDLMQVVEDRKAIIASMKEVGDKEGINRELDQLSSQLQQISKAHEITDDDIESYQEITKEIQHLTSMNRALQNERIAIASIDSVMQQRDSYDRGISLLLDKFTDAIKRTQLVADAHWLRERDEIIKQINEQLTNVKKALAEQGKRRAELAPKIEQNQRINQLSDAIAGEQKKLVRLSELDAELQKVNAKYRAKVAVLTGVFDKFKSCYEAYAVRINELFKAPTEELEFRVSCVYRRMHLLEKLNDILDSRLGQNGKARLERIVDTPVRLTYSISWTLSWTIPRTALS